jgi:ATP-dependent DNA helicase RecG
VFAGRPYQRVQSTTSVMPQAEYERRLLERAHVSRRWELLPAEGYRVADLDEDEVRQAVTESMAAGRLVGPWEGVPETLRRFRLLAGDTPTQAAVAAFARDPLPNYPQCALRMARFRGVTKDEFLDNRQVTGHAFRLLREAMDFLGRHLPVAGRFEPGLLQRIDEPLFPPLALREALVNALIHRDYAAYGGAVNVAVFDDRIEVSSAGTLPFGLTPADLTRDHLSQPRNPYLADVFFRRGFIERWGRGTQNIVALCVAAGHPAPRFEEQAGHVVVRFLVKGYVPPHRIGHDLTERQRRILFVLRDGELHGRGDIKQAIDPALPDSTLRDDLRLLRSLGLILSSGRGKAAGWRLKIDTG